MPNTLPQKRMQCGRLTVLATEEIVALCNLTVSDRRAYHVIPNAKIMLMQWRQKKEIGKKNRRI
jgi:hypothetical protein